MIALSICGPRVDAAQEAVLRSVRGTVGYQVTKDAPFTRVFGSFVVADNQFAVTQSGSNGLLALADSSEIALGESTIVQVGQLMDAASATPTSVTLSAGTLRFSVRHPAGQRSNYLFRTVTSQLAVRGTIGLYSTGPNGDVVSCLDCAAGDAAISAAGQTITLLTGQTAFISVAGVITVAATSALVAASFSHAGLSTISNSPSPFTPGVASSTTGASIGTTAAIVGGAAGAAAIITTATGQNHTSAPTPVVNQNGSLGITSATRRPETAPELPSPVATIGPLAIPQATERRAR